MQEKVIDIQGLSKLYHVHSSEMARLADFLFHRGAHKEVYALKDVNLTVYKGEIVGFMGLNGSGKSTLSRIIAGITHPSGGTMNIVGSVSMLSSGVGMNNYLTGRENIYYKCLLLGFTRAEIAQMEDKIIEFADIGMYIDQPLRMYSSGMRSRLGFAISIHINPDILIVDEALSVGDASFSEKCMDRMRELCSNGKTVIFVSHSVGQMEKFCTKILWLHKGKTVGYGNTQDIIPSYKEFSSKWRKMPTTERSKYFPTIPMTEVI